MINGETHSLRKKKYRHRKKPKAKQKKQKNYIKILSAENLGKSSKNSLQDKRLWHFTNLKI